MATQLQLRRGNTAQTAVFTGAIAEVTVDTDQKTVVVHDGTTVGGTYIITRGQLNSNVSILQGINNTQNTNITSVNGFAAGAYNTANGANGLAQSAYNSANTNAGNIAILQGVDLTQNNDIIAVNNYAASAYGQANTNATNITSVNNFAAGAYDTANGANGLAAGAYNHANSAYSYTTQVEVIAQSGWNKANSAFDSSNAVNTFAQSAYDTANAVNNLASGAYDTANGANGLAAGAYNTANGANGLAASAYDTANGANGLAQGAFNAANTNGDSITIIQGINSTQNTRLNSIETINLDQNTSITIIQGVDVTQNTRLDSIETVNSDQNTAITIIQGVDNTQNTRLNSIETINTDQNTAITIIEGVNSWQNTEITAVNNYAAAAYNKANTGGTFTGSVTIDQDLTVSGNVFITGNVISQGAQDLIINDPLIYVANNNIANLVDIGLVGNFDNGTYQHTGIVRDASANQWKLFSNVVNEPTTTVDFTGAIWDDLQLGTLYGNVVAQTVVVNGVDFAESQATQNTNITSVNNYAASAYAQANTNSDSITIIQGVNATQNTRLGSIETINNDQNTTITIIQGVDATQNTRLDSIETVNLDQNTAITIIQGVDATQNTEIQGIQGVDLAQNAAITIIQGVDATQNTRLNSIETVNLDQNTAITIIQGVDNTQNTNITAVNNYAAGAYALANTAVQKAGDTMTGTLTVPSIALNNGLITSNTFTTVSTAQVTIDSFSTSTYRSAKYQVQIDSGIEYHVIELRVVHDGTTTWLAQYGEIITGLSLGTFDTDISGGNVRLLFTGANAVSTIKVIREAINI